MNLNDRPMPQSMMPTCFEILHPRPSNLSLGRSPPRGGPPSSYRPVPASHRHSRSNDENLRAGVPPSPEKLIDIFATPEKEKKRHVVVRRNSETSVLDVRLDEQRERRKAREARARERDGKSRDPKKPKKPNPQMDIIDKLDVTSIYGTGSKCNTSFTYDKG